MDACRIVEHKTAQRCCEDPLAIGFAVGGVMCVRIGCVLSLSLGVLIHAVPVVGQQGAIDSNTEMLVRLLSPVSTANAKGDKITAQVIAPEKFQGDFLEGSITASK